MKAVVFIDVQNDFIDGTLGSAWARKVAPDIINFAKACRNRGYALYATADTHEKTTAFDGDGKPQNGYLTTLEGKRLPVEHCIDGTWGHQIVYGLVKDGGEDNDVIIPEGHILDKITFGSLLIGRLIQEEFGENGSLKEPLDEIIVCGFCTSICVSANAQLLRARFPNVPIVIVENLCADINEESHKAALAVLRNCQMDVCTWDGEKLVGLEDR